MIRHFSLHPMPPFRERSKEMMSFRSQIMHITAPQVIFAPAILTAFSKTSFKYKAPTCRR
tara:strand:+ start:10987 stop:11166 length:180 start_codon:yes stop_codon:yes gene_type:complete